MKTFEEFQAAATKLPASLRNNRDRINFPITGLQQEASKIGALLAQASASDRFSPIPQQSNELRDRLADVLWYAALLCDEASLPMQEVATHALEQLRERLKQLDPDAR